MPDTTDLLARLSAKYPTTPYWSIEEREEVFAALKAAQAEIQEKERELGELRELIEEARHLIPPFNRASVILENALGLHPLTVEPLLLDQGQDDA